MTADEAEDDKPRGRCPICRRSTEPSYRPFCSRRCADVDLARWLGGKYAIAADNADEDEDGDDPTEMRDPVDG